MFFNTKLMKIMLDSTIGDHIKDLDKIPLTNFMKVISANNFGYLPYYE